MTDINIEALAAKILKDMTYYNDHSIYDLEKGILTARNISILGFTSPTSDKARAYIIAATARIQTLKSEL